MKTTLLMVATCVLVQPVAAAERRVTTVDVTPRRCQQFKPRHSETITWINTVGGSGTVTADKWGLVTVTRVKIKPDEETILTLKKR